MEVCFRVHYQTTHSSFSPFSALPYSTLHFGDAQGGGGGGGNRHPSLPPDKCMNPDVHDFPQRAGALKGAVL